MVDKSLKKLKKNAIFNKLELEQNGRLKIMI